MFLDSAILVNLAPAPILALRGQQARADLDTIWAHIATITGHCGHWLDLSYPSCLIS
jgi:hypothetical protein